MSNKAAWIKEAKGKPLVVEDAALGKPGEGQVLIKNHAVAINPVDWKVQDYGIFLQKYPQVLGEDVAGEIVELGEGVTRFPKGDRVIAHCIYLVNQDPSQGAFQLYTMAFANLVAKIPDAISFEQGVVLPLAVSTAASGLYMKNFLDLPAPSKNPGDTGKVIFINGASSSVGAVTIQLAVASGLRVITTASPQHHDAAKALGAKDVFNHKDSDVLEKVVQAVKSAGDFAGVYDAIATPQTRKFCMEVASRLGGGLVAMTMPLDKGEDVPEGVKADMCFAPAIETQEPEVARKVWQEWVEEALIDGQLKCKPDPIVVGTGLESIQAAMDKHKQGVSGQKVVVTL